jgi:uncharacterized membrane protein (UPF0127 family)
MKRWALTIGTLLIVIISGAVLWGKVIDSQSTLQLAGKSYAATILTSEDEREKGLSGTPSLATDRAMLFVFPNDSKWGIWMKDMNYPIDIVWLDSGHKVVHMVKNAQPSSYPDTIFQPERPARYVIELVSGTIERTGISIGDIAGMPAGT